MVHRIEPAGPGGHHAAARVGDHLDDRGLVRAEQPDAVGEVGRAEFLVALAFGAMTDRAIVGVDLPCPPRDPSRAASTGWRSRARNSATATISSRLSMPSRPKAGIWLSCALAWPERTPILDRLLDLVERAAPQPVIVVEVRIALGAAAARAVARPAILAERRAALRIGEVGERLVGLDVGERGRGELFRSSARACALSASRSFTIAAREFQPNTPVRVGGDERPGRIDDPVADAQTIVA